MTETLGMSRTPFDALAATYDTEFEQAPVSSLLRSTVQSSLFRHFPAGSHVLDLGAGTGTDAIALAERGVLVTAVDSSSAMAERFRSKAGEKDLAAKIEYLTAKFEDLRMLRGRRFDGAYSNLGALNCTRDLSAVVQELSLLIRPGGSAVLCLLNRLCLWEICSFAARGNLTSARRRWSRDGADVTLGHSTIHAWYHSPGEVERMLKPLFTVERIFGLSILSPPPHSLRFANNHPTLTAALLRIDDSIRSTTPFSLLGDHFVIEARRAGR